MESLHQFRRLEVREKARNVFVMSLRLSDHKVLHNIASSSSFFNFARIFLLFSLVFRTSKFNKTIIPFPLVGYETGYSQLGTTISYPTRAHGIIVNYNRGTCSIQFLPKIQHRKDASLTRRQNIRPRDCSGGGNFLDHADFHLMY